jgi:hypothetical protein
METLVYVPIADLTTIRDLLSQKIEHYETQFKLAQAEDKLTQYKPAGFPTGKLCAYCGKAMFDGTEEEADRIRQLPPDQPVAHAYCHEIKTLREEIGKKDHGLHIIQSTTGDPNPDAAAPAPAPEPAPNQSLEPSQEDARASA